MIKKDDPQSEVLDGQQRLTTLTILLAVLRDYLSEEYAAEIDDMIVQKKVAKIRGINDTYRLRLRNRDNDFFKKIYSREGCSSKI
ncbi:hypothetical protein GCM10020331_073780 [Ectobacillus funiculus]